MYRSIMVASLLPLLLTGCSSESTKFARVSGRVTVNGQPLANASVVFSPIGGKDKINPGPGSGARTDADGRYTLTVVGKDTKGAVVGKHRVSITRIFDADSADDSRKHAKQLPPKYHDKTSELEFDVLASGTDTADFELTES